MLFGQRTTIKILNLIASNYTYQKPQIFLFMVRSIKTTNIIFYRIHTLVHFNFFVSLFHGCIFMFSQIVLLEKILHNWTNIWIVTIETSNLSNAIFCHCFLFGSCKKIYRTVNLAVVGTYLRRFVV